MIYAIYDTGNDTASDHKTHEFKTPQEASMMLQEYESKGYECTSIYQHEDTLTYNLMKTDKEEKCHV